MHPKGGEVGESKKDRKLKEGGKECVKTISKEE